LKSADRTQSVDRKTDLSLDWLNVARSAEINRSTHKQPID